MTNPILAKLLTSLHQRDTIKECLLFLALDGCDTFVARYEDLDRWKSAKSVDTLFTKHELQKIFCAQFEVLFSVEIL
jgi:hypothetical protein